MPKRSTSTSAFGVSKREGHDASGFYRRFTPPDTSGEHGVHPDKNIDKLIVADSRSMVEVPDASVALVVTSPPYFAGKEYEEALGEGGVPATYLDYLDLLREVFAECVRTLEPGGRIAVNVANLGRRPYRSLSADVIGILQDDLRLLLRGEIIWVKQAGSSGSCAWGSFQRPANPVLRDLTERVIVASKGRFDRAVAAAKRTTSGLPSEATMTREDFMEGTLDMWEIPPESATRVGHPAPFPVELPARLMDLYTYRGDLVLDPFVGSGSVAVAAVQRGRHFVGYDLDEGYIRLAEERVAAARQAPPAAPALTADAVAGLPAKDLARAVIEAAGFRGIKTGADVDFTATDEAGVTWFFDVGGKFTTHRPGLRRTEAVWKALARASLVKGPLVVLTPALPTKGTVGAKLLKQACGPGLPIRAVIDVTHPRAAEVLRDRAF